MKNTIVSDALMKQIKLLRPKKGDILVLPEGAVEPAAISFAIKSTKIQFALIVPDANASLLPRNEAIKLLKAIENKGGDNKK